MPCLLQTVHLHIVLPVESYPVHTESAFQQAENVCNTQPRCHHANWALATDQELSVDNSARYSCREPPVSAPVESRQYHRLYHINFVNSP